MFKLTFPVVNIYRQASPHQIGKCFMEENYFLRHNLPSWQPGLIKRFFIEYLKKKILKALRLNIKSNNCFPNSLLELFYNS